MTTLQILGEGRVRVAALTVLNDTGVDNAVAIEFTPNTSEGWLVISQDKALELAARLMVYAEGGEA